MKNLEILLIEDNPDDIFIMEQYVGEFSEKRYFDRKINLFKADCMKAAIDVLKANSIDIVLLDLTLPDSSGMDTIYKLKDYIHKIPIIILTGSNDEEVGIESIKKGAQDYLVKNKIGPELIVRSIKYSIERFGILREKEDLIEELENASKKIRALRGFLPICSNCKKIRDDSGYWEQVEEYIKSHSLAEFTHSICPECAKKLYHDFSDLNE
jgi:DNA-binding response OmpR family regulator